LRTPTARTLSVSEPPLMTRTVDLHWVTDTVRTNAPVGDVVMQTSSPRTASATHRSTPHRSTHTGQHIPVITHPVITRQVTKNTRVRRQLVDIGSNTHRINADDGDADERSTNPQRELRHRRTRPQTRLGPRNPGHRPHFPDRPASQAPRAVPGRTIVVTTTTRECRRVPAETFSDASPALFEEPHPSPTKREP